MRDKDKTPASTLKMARKIALSSGIKFCYTGNVHDPEGQTTFCPNCNGALIKRDWHDVINYNLKDDACPNCKTKIPGRFDVSLTSVAKN